MDLCGRVHAIREHANRTNCKTYNLKAKLPAMTHDERIAYHAKWLFDQKSPSGRSKTATIEWVLHGGTKEKIPERIWEVQSDRKQKVPHLGVSSLGEIVGWAFPDYCPPRNGRTSKALTALGYRVTIHSKEKAFRSTIPALTKVLNIVGARPAPGSISDCGFPQVTPAGIFSASGSFRRA